MGWRDKAQNEMDKKRAGKRFKFTVGENTIRVLPTLQHADDAEPAVFTAFMVHQNVGPEKRWLTCGKGMSGKGKCYTCDKKIPRLEASESRAQNKMAQEAKAVQNLMIQVAKFNPDNSKFSGPFPLPLKGGGPDSNSFRILKALRNPKRDCVDPIHGHNIGIEATGEGLARRYSAPEVDDDETKVPRLILEGMKTFDQLVDKYDEQKHIEAWSTAKRREEEDEDVDEDEDEEEDRPKKKKRPVEDDEDEDEAPPKKKKRPVDDDEDEEEDEDEAPPKKKKKPPVEDDEDEEEEEDEAPAPKKKRKPPVDDDDEEEDEDEDEAPPKKKKCPPVEDDEDEEDEDEDEDEAPAPKKKKKPPVEDDEEEEDEEEEEEDEEPAPKKKKRPPVDEDEDEEEEEEEEEEEPAPKKKKAPVKKAPPAKKKSRR